MKTLQNIIICALEQIRKQYENNCQSIEICVVSNAHQKWLDYMFKGSKEHFISSRIPILHKYFQHNEISVISAPLQTKQFLQEQFSDKAAELFEESKQNRWIWKYTTFASIICSAQIRLNKKCNNIISIGDGNAELIAMK
eukprot:346816_1